MYGGDVINDDGSGGQSIYAKAWEARDVGWLPDSKVYVRME